MNSDSVKHLPYLQNTAWISDCDGMTTVNPKDFCWHTDGTLFKHVCLGGGLQSTLSLGPVLPQSEFKVLTVLSQC